MNFLDQEKWKKNRNRKRRRRRSSKDGKRIGVEKEGTEEKEGEKAVKMGKE